MTLLPDEIIKGLLLLLAKGAGWLTLCGLIRWTLPAIKLSWRLALSSLILLTIAGLLPALWTWTLPAPLPALQTKAAISELTTLSTEASTSAVPVSTPPAPPRRTLDRPWQHWLAMLWLGGTGGLVLWLLTGFRTAHSWIRQAMPLTDPAWHQSLVEICRQASLRRIPRLLINPDIPGPCVAGCFRPVLLLPACCREWDGETRSVVLQHEVAHLRRGDPPHALVRSLALTIHWLNRLVWLAVSRSRHAEEMAADAAVLASGIPPGRYATTLLFIARSCQFTNPTPLVTAMAHSSNLELRIRQLLRRSPPPQCPLRFAAAGIGFTFLTAAFIGCSTVQRESPNWTLPGAPTPIASIDGAEQVVLTDNKSLSPTFSQRETPFTAAALPGKTYRLRLNLKHPDAFLEITASPE